MGERYTQNRNDFRPGVQLTLPILAPVPAETVKESLARLEGLVEKKGELSLKEAADDILGFGQGRELSELIRAWSFLLEEGKITLLRNSTPAPLPDSLLALENPGCWNHYRIRPRKRVPREELERIRMILGDFLESETTGDADEVVDGIRRGVRRWSMELIGWEASCRRWGSPGRKTILDCLEAIRRLGRIPGSDELLEAVQQDEFRVWLDRLRMIRVYGNVGILFWKSFQKTAARWEAYENELRAWDGFSTVSAELAWLRDHPEPWNAIDRIRQITSWMREEMDRVDRERLDRAKRLAMEEVDARIADVYRMYPEKNRHVDERRQALFSLRQLRKKLEMAESRRAVESVMEDALFR